MTTYYTFYATLLLATIIVRAGRDHYTAFYWTVLFVLFLFVGLRWEVGCDWPNYLRHYALGDSISYDSDLVLMNPGHWYLIRLLRDLGLSYVWLNIAYSAIFFAGLHVLARRQPDPLAFMVLCFPILIINMPMAAIRQAAAIGFFALACVAFFDRRTLAYVAWILLGSTFHSSILIFLLIGPFINGRFNRQNILIGTVLAMPIAYALLQTGAAELAENRYIGTEIEASGAVFRLGILLVSGTFFLYVLGPAWRRQFPDDYELAVIGAWLMVGFFSLLFLSSVIGDRFGYYLIPIQAMIFARIPYLHLGKLRNFYVVSPYVMLTFVFVFWTQFSEQFNYCYLPYQSAFE